MSANEPSGNGARWKRPLRLLIGLVVSALFLWRTFASIDLAEVGEAFRGGAFALVALGFVPFLGSWVLRAMRWRTLLVGEAPSVGRLFSFMLIGNLGNAIFPMRAGDVLRTFLVETASPLSFSRVFASLFTEKLWDLLVICGYLVLAIALLGGRELPSWVYYAMAAGGCVFVAVLVFVVGFTVGAAQTDRFIRWLGQKLPGNVGERLTGAAQGFREGLAVAGEKRRLAVTTLLSCAAWGLELWAYVIWSRAVGVVLAPAAAMLVMTVANLSLLVPAAPGGVGTYDYACSRAIGLFAAGPQGLAAALLIHAAMYVGMVCLGGVCLLVESARLGSNPLQALRAKRDSAPSPTAETTETGGRE